MQGEYKTMTVFPRNSVMGTVPCRKQHIFSGVRLSCTYQNCDPLTATQVKMLTFYRKGPFDLKLEYEDTTACAWGEEPGPKIVGPTKLAADLSTWRFPNMGDPQVTLVLSILSHGHPLGLWRYTPFFRKPPYVKVS